jgi:YD repeat-containing protein
MKMVTRLLLALVALSALTGAAAAQSKRYYDPSGKSLGTSSTDSQGTTTFYDAAGKVTGRATKSGDTTTIYDPAGRNVGKSTGTSR